MKFLATVLFLFSSLANAGTFYAFGDSITYGVGAPYPYVNTVSAYYESPKVNKGISGSQISGQSASIYGTNFTVNDTSLFLTGYNDMRYHGSDSSSYQENLEASLAYMGSSSKVKAINMTATGSWSATPSNTIGRYSSSGSSTLFTNITGNIIYIGSIHQVTNSGSFKVEIDGIDYGTYQTAGGAQHSNSINYNPYLIRLDVGAGTHSVVITRLTGQIFIDWVGSNVSGQGVYVTGCLRMPTASYALGSPFNKGSDAIADAYTTIIQNAVTLLANDGLNIHYVTNSYTVSMIGPDNIHPGESGQMHIAIPLIQAIGIK